MLAFISINGTVGGVVVFSDRIRQGVTSMIQDLKQLGVERTVMLTGDTNENA